MGGGTFVPPCDMSHVQTGWENKFVNSLYSHNKGSSDVISRSYGTLIHFNCAYQLEMEISLRKGVNVQDWNDFFKNSDFK